MCGRARVDAGGRVVEPIDDVRVARHRWAHQRAVGDLVDHPGGGQLDRSVARRARPGAEQFHGGVVAAAHDGCAGDEPTFGGRSRGDLADDRRRIDDRRKGGRRPADQRAQLVGPPPCRRVGQQGPDRVAVVGVPIVGELEPQPVLGEVETTSRGRRIGIVARDPQQLRKQPGRIDAVEREFENARVGLVAELCGFGGAP